MNTPPPPPPINEIIFEVFGVRLPIRGGMGNSIENAVIIEYTQPLNDYVSIEHEVLKYIALGRELQSWNLVQQQLIFENGKTYDKLKLRVVLKINQKLFQQNEYFYFDITECFGREQGMPSDEDKKMAEMKLFLEKLNEAIDKKNNNESDPLNPDRS